MELHNRKQKGTEVIASVGDSGSVNRAGPSKLCDCAEDYEPGLAQRLLGYAVLVVGSALIMLELVLYSALRIAIHFVEWVRFGDVKKRMDSVQSYDEWVNLAKELDVKLGKEAWKSAGTAAHKCAHPRCHIHNNFYDCGHITRLTKALNAHKNNVSELLPAIHASCVHNVGGIENSELYSHTFHGTKVFVQEFYNALESSLEALKSIPASKKDYTQKTLRDISANWGRTALFLSGGGAMAYPDLGVVRGLLERGLLPRILCGSSCGSLVAALVCLRSDQEALEVLRDPEAISRRFVFNDEAWGVIAHRLRTEGCLVDHRRWAERLQWVTFGNTTFLEAYKKTGKILNISVTDVATSSPILLNYIVPN